MIEKKQLIFILKIVFIPDHKYKEIKLRFIINRIKNKYIIKKKKSNILIVMKIMKILVIIILAVL